MRTNNLYTFIHWLLVAWEAQVEPMTVMTALKLSQHVTLEHVHHEAITDADYLNLCFSSYDILKRVLWKKFFCRAKCNIKPTAETGLDRDVFTTNFWSFKSQFFPLFFLNIRPQLLSYCVIGLCYCIWRSLMHNVFLMVDRCGLQAAQSNDPTLLWGHTVGISDTIRNISPLALALWFLFTHEKADFLVEKIIIIMLAHSSRAAWSLIITTTT